MSELRRRMGKAIVDFEARRVNGKIAVYELPANDGGGAFEVAGINVRYHPAEANALKALIEAGRHDEAEARAGEYVIKYTDAVKGWHTDPGVEFYLRDSAFNRGPKGAARILQRAVGVEDDGEIGPDTRAAMARLSPSQLLTGLRAGREDYERNVVGYRANFWRGLVNRWDKALVEARKFSAAAPAPQPQSSPAPQSRGLLQAIIDFIVGLFGRKPAAPTPQAPREPRWFIEAKKDIGFRETGTNRGIDQFIREASVGNLGDAWCAIWVNAKLEECGVPGSRSAMARSFEKHKNFVKLSGPALGAIATFWRGSPSAGTGHVNFYAGTDERGRHLGLGGNQSDSVNVVPMDMTRHTGWWWPKGEPLPTIGPVRVRLADISQAGSET